MLFKFGLFVGKYGFKKKKNCRFFLVPIPNKSSLEFGIQNSSVSVFGIGIGQYRPFFGIGTGIGIGIDNPVTKC